MFPDRPALFHRANTATGGSAEPARYDWMASFVGARSIAGAPLARPDLSKITLGSAGPGLNPPLLLVLVRDLLVLVRDLLVDRDPDHAETAVQGQATLRSGDCLGPAGEVVAEPPGEWPGPGM